MFDAPHGAVCAHLLPPVMAANVRALKERDPAAPALARYREVAAILTGDPAAEVADGVAWVRALGDELAVPGLGDYGLSPNARSPQAGPAEAGTGNRATSPNPAESWDNLRILRILAVSSTITTPGEPA